MNYLSLKKLFNASCRVQTFFKTSLTYFASRQNKMNEQQKSAAYLPEGGVSLAQTEQDCSKSRSVAQRNESHERKSQSEQSSSRKNLKLPESIVRHIAEQAKQQEAVHNKPSTNGQTKKTAEADVKSKKKIDKGITSTCEICELDFKTRHMMSISRCKHKYCGQCLYKYIVYTMKSFKEVSCPFVGCDRKIDQQSPWFPKLPLQLRQKYKKIKRYSQLQKNSGQRICSNENCQGFLQPSAMSEQLQEVSCSVCKKAYCSRCDFEKHSGMCESNQLAFYLQTLKYRQCRKCKQVIEKSAGCKHMTCKCKYQFCYICGVAWDSGHNCRTSSPVRVSPPELNMEVHCDHFLLAQAWSVLKWLLISLCAALLLPCLLFNAIVLIMLRAVTGVAIGVVAFPALICYLDLKYTCLEIALMVTFAPFTLVYFVVLAMTVMFDRNSMIQIVFPIVVPLQSLVSRLSS